MSDPMRRSFLRTFGQTPQSIRNPFIFRRFEKRLI